MALMGPSTFAFSVVRDPVDQFESLYNYMSLRATYKTVWAICINLFYHLSAVCLLLLLYSNFFEIYFRT